MTASPTSQPIGGVSTAGRVGADRLAGVLPPAPNRPPEHVLAAFGVAVEIEPLAGGRGRTWRAGDAVIRPVDNSAEVSWLASVLEQRAVPGVRIARPIRSSDGRWVVSGWSAHRFVAGRPEPRIEAIRQTGLALHAALADVPEPRFLRFRSDLHSWADRLSWGEILDTDERLGHGHAAAVFHELAAGRRPVGAPAQVVHGELFRKVLFAGSAAPAVVDIAPYWRPVGWAIGVLAVDAVARGDAPIELLAEWSDDGVDGADWPQLVRRAMLFRLAVSLAHPLTPPAELVRMLSTAERVDRIVR